MHGRLCVIYVLARNVVESQRLSIITDYAIATPFTIGFQNGVGDRGQQQRNLALTGSPCSRLSLQWARSGVRAPDASGVEVPRVYFRVLDDPGVIQAMHL
jgi:hypothetical protein